MSFGCFPLQDDFVVAHQRREQLSKYDRFFKKFEHSKALDAALDVSLSTVIVIPPCFYLLVFLRPCKRPPRQVARWSRSAFSNCRLPDFEKLPFFFFQV